MPLRNGTVYSIYSKLRLIKNLNPEEKNLHAEGDSTKDLHSALLEFQKEKTAAGLGAKLAKASKDGPSYAYTDLKTTLQAVQSGAKFGLVHHVSFHPIGETTIMVKLTITHIHTGQEISSEMPVSTQYTGVRNQSQAFGSAVTYAKKYLYWGLYGLANADDDGEAVGAVEEKSRGQNSAPPVSYNNQPKQVDQQTKEERLIAEVKDIYGKDPKFKKEFNQWLVEKQLKNTFSVETLSDNEIYLDLRKQVTAYNLDHKK